jgi:hypothetical protein
LQCPVDVAARGVRLENFGSFAFLSAVGIGGWENANVPKCVLGWVGSVCNFLSV